MSSQPGPDAPRARIAVSRPALPGDAVTRLSETYDVRIWAGTEAPSSSDLAEFIGDAEGLLGVAKDTIDDRLIDACPKLRGVAIASTGYDYVDIEAVRRRGLSVTHTPAVLSDAVADHALFLITGARRRAHEQITMLRTGAWDHHLALDELLGLDIYGATLGLIGYGQVGKAIARRAAGYEMNIQEYSRGPHDDRARPVELHELLQTSDVIVMCLPLLPETRKLIGQRELRMMKPTATLVNVGRGATLDETALARALQENWIHSAGIDVFDKEPIPDLEHPLLSLPNAFLTPHMASATEAARALMVSIAADDLHAMMQGRPPSHLLSELRNQPVNATPQRAASPSGSTPTEP